MTNNVIPTALAAVAVSAVPERLVPLRVTRSENIKLAAELKRAAVNS